MIPRPDQLQEISRLREGDLAEIPFPVLLLALAAQRQTAVLEVRRKMLSKQITVEHGTPIDCRSNLAHETLGRYLVGQGRLREEDLVPSLAQAASRHVPLGEVLLEHKILTAEELFKTLQQNLAQKMLDIFTWRDGQFRLLFEVPKPESSLRIRVPQLIVTGIIKCAPQEQVDAGVAPLVGKKLALHPEPPFSLDEIRLTPRHAQAAAALRAGWRIDELATGTGLPFEEITRLLYALAILGVVVTSDQLPKAERSTSTRTPVTRLDVGKPAGAPASPNGQVIAAIPPSPATSSVPPVPAAAAIPAVPATPVVPAEAAASVASGTQAPGAALPAPTPPTIADDSGTVPESRGDARAGPETTPSSQDVRAGAEPAAAPLSAPAKDRPSRVGASTVSLAVEPAAPAAHGAASGPGASLAGAAASSIPVSSLPAVPRSTAAGEPTVAALSRVAGESPASEAALPASAPPLAGAAGAAETSGAGRASGVLPAHANPHAEAVSAERRNEIVQAFLSYRRQDAFDLLGVAEDASFGAIESRYLDFASRFAPWVLAGANLAGIEEKARDVFLAGARAYSELMDLEQRNILLFRRRTLRDERAKRPGTFAIKTDLLDSEAQFRKGKALMDSGKHKEALQLLEFASDCDPQNGLYSAELAYCRFLHSTANAGKALKELEETLRREPDCGIALYYSGEIHRQLGNAEAAEPLLRRAIKVMSPDRRPIEALKSLATSKKR